MVHIVRQASDSPTVGDDAMQAFRDQWQVYQKLVNNNYLSHREVRDILHRQLAETITRPFRFLDLACGDASMTVAALKETSVTEYHGIDLSAPALAMAKKTVASLSCRARLEQHDFVAAIRERTDPADVVYIGLSLHHLQTAEDKRRFMRAVRSAIGDNGLFLIFEPASLEGETRPAFLERYEAFINAVWTAFTPTEKDILWTHVRTCDFPEQPSIWTQLGHDAGFSEVQDLFTDAPQLLKVFSYRP
jgi:cyclopropane fatty-acyl-phospholipid synthase-like methyltransferase